MNKSNFTAILALFVAVSAVFGAYHADAQTTITTLYNADGSSVTTTSGPGYYYTQPGGQTTNQVYYYGNGTYYNASTGQYFALPGYTVIIPGQTTVTTTTSGNTTTTTTGSTTFYNSDGSIASSPVPAGYYYTAPGANMNDRVYYFGNGSYYNPTTGAYGTFNGSTGGISIIPTFPNTGAGGNAFANWMTLILSGLVTLAGGAYIARRLAVR